MVRIVLYHLPKQQQLGDKSQSFNGYSIFV